MAKPAQHLTMTLHQTIKSPTAKLSLTDFPITAKWPAVNPDILQLYSLPTPNGIKVLVALKELGIDYESHIVSLSDADQHTPEFRSLNPNNKIPAIIDPNGPDGTPLPLWESGAILIYLAEKTGKLLPADPAKRYQAIQWMMFQIGGLEPMVGQIGFFHKFAGKEYEDKRPLQRYIDETARLLRVLDGQLQGRDWIVDEFSMADIAIAPWLRNIRDGYQVSDLVGWSELENVPAYLGRFLARPSVQASLPKP